MWGKNRLEALLSKGYFPKELPHVFTTQSFGANSIDILKEWETAELFHKCDNDKKYKKKNGSYGYKLRHSELETISTPKKGFERRNVHITHPIPQSLLAYELSFNWKAVQKWLSRQTYSMDEIKISKNHPRSIKGIVFELHRVKQAYIEATSDWLVKTDITRFYPSIYTHSIPWAAYGKEKVKDNLKSYEGSLADRLDFLVRSCNRNQTVGIPIGPETSRVLAEIISSRIDSDFLELSDPSMRENVDRLQDDWFIGLKDLESAETTLAAITSVYRSYGLDINGSKTSISRVVTHAKEAWISEIGAFLSHRPGPLIGARLREFLNLVLRLQTSYENQAVTNYALTVLENHKSSKSDVAELESFLLKASIVSPGSMSRICELLLNLDFDTNRVSKKRICSRFTELAERNLTNGNTYEAIWQIYTIRGLGIRMKTGKISEMAKNIPSSALALVLLDMDKRGLCTGSLPKAYWEDKITKNGVMTDWTWLLAYEGFRNGWLNDAKNIMNEPFFKAMNSCGVVFYDPKRNVPKTAKTVFRRSLVRSFYQREIAKFLLHTRGFDMENY
ncbi:RNA-directed DNA polymerase [Parasphingorhabdus sp. JC815]|uniref:RNA-directed DNA polymerase n=1 Tax=Parasphingorhabdus sp. JC815 TaxID=3232140 RepID=UPI00345980CB